MIRNAENQAKFQLPSYITPASVTLVLLAIFLAFVIWSYGGDALGLARLGTYFSQGVEGGTAGYDGQFVYYIARDPAPERVSQFLDIPAYRYQRILYPLLSRALAFGRIDVIPWAMVVLGLASQVLGTWLLEKILVGWGVSRWYALTYGLYTGLVLAVRLDLPESMAFALIVAAILATERNRPRLSWLLFGLALFAKEVTGIFLAAALLSALLQRRWRDVIGLTVIAGLPFLIFQVWLWRTFGQFGVNSGGAMSTPFELVPFMGLWRVGAHSVKYLIAMLIVFGPAIIVPTLWGLWASLKRLLGGQTIVVVLALFLNALVVLFVPFSTFRESGGILRFACGLVLSVLLFAGKYNLKKVLNYSLFWLVLNAFLFNT